MAGEYVFIDEWEVDAPQGAVRLEPPHEVEAHVDGDLRGRDVWTLAPRGDRIHVRFDWRVFADRPLLRVLTPLLRPVFRWNHTEAIKRAMVGLEPYARARAGNQCRADGS